MNYKEAPAFPQVNQAQEGHKEIENMFLPKRELWQASKKCRCSKKKKKKKGGRGGGGGGSEMSPWLA